MHLGHEVLLPEQGEEDVVHVDGQDVHEAAGAGGVDGVAGVVGVRPGVGPGGQAPVCQEIQHLLVRILLTERRRENKPLISDARWKGCVNFPLAAGGGQDAGKVYLCMLGETNGAKKW